MTILNFPPFEFKFSEEDGQRKIFDIIRKKHLVLTPEEWVRQHMVHFLIEYKQYPKGLMAIEKSIKMDGLIRRPDIVIYDRDLKPLMIVELKAPEIVLKEDVILQIAMYNKVLKSPFIILSNGIKHFCAKVNYIENRLDFLEDIPEYKHLLK